MQDKSQHSLVPKFHLGTPYHPNPILGLGSLGFKAPEVCPKLGFVD